MNSTFPTLLALLATAAFAAEPPAPRVQLLQRMEQVMGKLPGPDRRCDLDIKVEDSAEESDHTRLLLTYQSEPGARVPAYLLLPKNRPASPKPFGVLTLHQTHPLGHKVVVGLGQSSNDVYAVELVRRGFLCLAPAYPHLANYAPSLTNYQSGTMKAIWDNIRGLDVLIAYGCDPGHFAAIGHSLGGHNSLFTAAFDERVKVVATSCGFDSFRDYMDGDIKGWTSHRYMPKLLDYSPDRYPFDFDTVLGAISPRLVFINAPIGDSNFRWASVSNLVAKVRRDFPACQLTLHQPAVGHVFPPEIRRDAFSAIEATLKSSRNSVRP